MSDDFQQEIAEWFVKVLKENLLWVRSFDTVEQLRKALLEFKGEKRTCSEAAA